MVSDLSGWCVQRSREPAPGSRLVQLTYQHPDSPGGESAKWVAESGDVPQVEGKAVTWQVWRLLVADGLRGSAQLGGFQGRPFQDLELGCHWLGASATSWSSFSTTLVGFYTGWLQTCCVNGGRMWVIMSFHSSTLSWRNRQVIRPPKTQALDVTGAIDTTDSRSGNPLTNKG